MPTLPTLNDLVAIIARTEGISETLVAKQARLLREAGLVSRSGHDKAAAHMSIADATNLLIAVNATSAAAEHAPKAIAWYRTAINGMRSPDRAVLGENVVEQAVLDKLAFVADQNATLGEVLDGLLALAAQGHLRRILHGIGLVHLAATPFPKQRAALPDPYMSEREERERVRRAMEAGDSNAIAELQEALRDDLDECIRLDATSVLVRFYRPYPGARVEVRRGGRNHKGRPEGGRCLLEANFELDFDDDEVFRQEDYFHHLRFFSRTEVVTIDQRALLAIGETLAGQEHVLPESRPGPA